MLYTFANKESCRGKANNPKGGLSLRRSINVRHDGILLSQLLCKELGIVHGSHLSFAIDEKKPDSCYIRIADDPDDTPLTQTMLVGWANKSRNTLRCRNAEASRHILNRVGADSSCVVHVSPKPLIENGKSYYRLIIEAPVFVK